MKSTRRVRSDSLLRSGGKPSGHLLCFAPNEVEPLMEAISGDLAKVGANLKVNVTDVAGWLAPMPGGVGPMTIALLLRNAVEAAERRARAS